MNLDKYLQDRNERKVAIISSVIFFVIYAVAAFVLAVNLARYFIFISLGNMMVMVITVLVILPPVTRVVQAEKLHPEWKSQSAKEAPLSKEFLTRSILIFVVGGLVLTGVFFQAMATKRKPVQPSIYQIPEPTTTVTELPSLKKED